MKYTAPKSKASRNTDSIRIYVMTPLPRFMLGSPDADGTRRRRQGRP
jgi:hypothetical protein